MSARQPGVALAVTLALTAGLGSLSCQTSGPPAGATQASNVERGEYLATVTGCNDCHTPGNFYGAPDFSRRLAGSDIGWVGPWGVVYAANLTPDPATGLGDWTEDEIVNAIRTGLRPDGRQLAPAMPWPGFSRLTDEDAYAIAAYLKSLPPIAHEEPAPVPPGQKAGGALLVIPPPPAWDAPREGAAGGAGH